MTDAAHDAVIGVTCDGCKHERHGLGLLTSADTTFFSAYCQSYARWRAAEEWLSENGATIILRDKDGKVRQIVRAPQAITAQAALADLNRMGQQFGLSPSARTSIGGAETPKPENKFMKLKLPPAAIYGP